MRDFLPWQPQRVKTASVALAMGKMPGNLVRIGAMIRGKVEALAIQFVHI